MRRRAGCKDWPNELDTNTYGRKVLTLRKALSMAAEGGEAGWYIEPYAMKWAIGRTSADAEK